jgi:putative DNA methylase
MGEQLLAIVTEGVGGRAYITSDSEHVRVAAQASPNWGPEQELAYEPRAIWCTLYGLTRFRDLFTPRQLVTLSTFSDLVVEGRQKAIADGASGEYADAICTYLAFGVDKASDRNTTLCSWESKMDRMRNTFGRQGLPMVWDYAETNPFAGAGGDLAGCIESLCEVLEALPAVGFGSVSQLDAAALAPDEKGRMFSTDPPYYDNIGYADLSDFFYVWLRRSLSIYPQLFSTLLVPKAQELIASPYRFNGSKERAREFFEAGFRETFGRGEHSGVTE